MWQNLIISILCILASISDVNSLYCYISDFENLYLKNANELVHSIQNCNNYNNITQHLRHKLYLPENSATNCYTVEFSQDTVIKGCVHSGGCKFLIDVLKNVLEENNKIEITSLSRKIECTECQRNGCNKNKNELLVRPTPPASLTALRGETSLKCYYCLEPCKLTNAREKICGENIGKSHEAVCTSEISKNSNNPNLAIRKCQVIVKNQKPPCPDSSLCSFCKSDLCTTSPLIISNSKKLETNGNLTLIITLSVIFLKRLFF